MVPDTGKVPFLVDTTEGGIPTAKHAGQQREALLLLRLRVRGGDCPSKILGDYMAF